MGEPWAPEHLILQNQFQKQFPAPNWLKNSGEVALYMLTQACRPSMREGRGGGGSPPRNFRATQIFWAARGNLGKASF